MFVFWKSVAAVCMLVATSTFSTAFAQNLFPEYCAYNPRMGGWSCSKTREQAEAHVMLDASPGFGRATLKKHEWNTPYGLGASGYVIYRTPMIPFAYKEGEWYQGVYPYVAGTIREACGGVGCESESELEARISGGLPGVYSGSHFENPPGWNGLGITNGRLQVNYTRPMPDGRKVVFDGTSTWWIEKFAVYGCPAAYWSYPQGYFRINFAAWPNTCSNDEYGQIEGSVRQTAQCEVGNPCIPGNGGKSAHEADFAWEGISFQRHYHSIRDFDATVGLGPAWSHTFGWRLHENSPNSSTIDVLNDGLTLELYRQIGSTGVFRSLNRSDQVLVKGSNASGTEWTLHLGGGESRVFDGQGRLTAMRWADDPQRDLSLDYCEFAEFQQGQCSVAGALNVVTSARGRALSFVYQPASPDDPFAPTRLSAVASEAGTLVEYGYDAQNRLHTASYPGIGAATTRTYLYNEPDHVCVQADGSPSPNCTFSDFPYHLTGIIDEAGNRYADYTYDDYGRVTRSGHAGGADLHTLQYIDPWRTKVTLPSGAVRDYRFTRPSEVFTRPLSVFDGVGTRSYTYRSDGRPQTITDARGTLTEYEYDTTYRTAVVEAKGTPEQRRREIDWNVATHRPGETRVREASGGLVEQRTMAYNARGQLAAATQVEPSTSATRSTTRTFCEAADVALAGTTCPILGLLKSIDGPRTDVADITNFEYYAVTDESGCASSGPCHRKGDLWKVTNALGHVTETLRYDLGGRVAAMKDPNGVVTELIYHPRGWLASRTVKGGSSGDDAVTTYDYDEAGQLERITRPDGDWTDFEYDDAHRLKAVEDALGNRVEYTLDAAGGRTAETTKDPSGIVTRSLSREYDALGRLDLSRDAYAHASDFDYDANGNQTSAVDPLGYETLQQYDPLDRLTRTLQDVGGLNVETQYGYDALDRLVKVTDPKGLDTIYTYDGFGDLTQLSSPDTGVTQYTYDAAGNRLTQTDARGITVIHSYDALNRLTGITYPTTTLNVAYFYDEADSVTGCVGSFPKGRLTRMTDASGSTTYCYDRRGNVASKTQQVGTTSWTLGYTYDLSDRLVEIDYPDTGPTVSYGRDSRGAITSVTIDGDPFVITVSRDPDGQPTSMLFADGDALQRTYDNNGAATSVVSSALDLHYSRNELGDVVGLGMDRAYEYDALRRLTQVKDGANTELETYTYDDTGNRLSKTMGGITQSYQYPAASHHLTDVAGAARTYDAAGSTLTADGDQYTYDDAHRLASVAGNGSATFVYNGRGERVRKNDEVFLFDEAGRQLVSTHEVVTGFACKPATCPPYCGGGSDEVEALTPGFADAAKSGTQPSLAACGIGWVSAPIYERKPGWVVWMDDLPIAFVPAHGLTLNEGVLEIHTDALGTPRALQRPWTNEVVWRWDLGGSAFGEHVAQNDPDGDNVEFEFGLRYPGQYFDAESGLYYNYFRDYEPGTGRYIESDPAGLEFSISTYAYVDAMPLLRSDPYGLGPEARDKAWKRARDSMRGHRERAEDGADSMWEPNGPYPVAWCLLMKCCPSLKDQCPTEDQCTKISFVGGYPDIALVENGKMNPPGYTCECTRWTNREPVPTEADTASADDVAEAYERFLRRRWK